MRRLALTLRLELEHPETGEPLAELDLSLGVLFEHKLTELDRADLLVGVARLSGVAHDAGEDIHWAARSNELTTAQELARQLNDFLTTNLDELELEDDDDEDDEDDEDDQDGDELDDGPTDDELDELDHRLERGDQEGRA